MYKIQVTANYKDFKYLPGNRQVVKSHVQDLIKSFEKNPNLAGLRPMLVNEKMEIIDGQHNLQASEILERKVSYVVVPGLTLETAQMLNAYQRPWKIMDYVNSYAMSGNLHYKKLLELTKKYNIPVSIMAVYLAGGQQKAATNRFRSGEFKIGNEAEAIKKLDLLSELAEVGNFWNTRPFAMAFWNVLKTKDYDHKRLLAGLEQSPVKRQATRIDYLREFERAYNYGRPSSAIRFF